MNVTKTNVDAAKLVEVVETYFARVDGGDIDGTLELMTPDCFLEVVTDKVRHEGRDDGVRGTFERRLEQVGEAWHGNFKHIVDVEQGRVGSRFDVNRTWKDGRSMSLDNINFFQFEGALIKSISVWMSNENTLL